MQATEDSTISQEEPRAPVARLLLDEPEALSRIVQCAPGATLRIGRDEEVELSVNDRKVSRVHAYLSHGARGLTVRDADSRNGTFIGPQRVGADEVPLAPGDVLRIGDTRVTVVGVPSWPPHALVQGAPPTIAAPEHAPRHAAGLHASTHYVAVDPVSAELVALARRLAASDLPLLIVGETGVGKEQLARVVHEHSLYAAGPFVSVRAAALPRADADRVLFGHDSVEPQPGLVDAAQGGTLFLDEVADLSPESQTQLLSLLRDGQPTRPASSPRLPERVRVLAATHRDLASLVAQKQFREDLYYRLRGAVLSVPPLRARVRDIVPIARQLVEARRPGTVLSDELVLLLHSQPWPGNVHQLRNALEYALTQTEGRELRAEHLPAEEPSSSAAAPPGRGELRERMDAAERVAILRALEAANGNQTRAARDLGLPRRTLLYRMQRLGLKTRARDAGDTE